MPRSKMVANFMVRRRAVPGFAALLCAAWVHAAVAAELVMFESTACEWCATWDEEIAPIYPRTPESRRAPLRRVDIHDPRPPDLASIGGILYTPTFVLVQDGVEVGRITGYPGEDFFWGLLASLIERLDQVPSTANARTIGEPSPCAATASC